MLDFGDRLSRLGPRDRVALVLVGAAEYPYSQTNYAAATAGVPIRPPVLERPGPTGPGRSSKPTPATRPAWSA